MNERSVLKVHVEFGEVRADFEGDADEVFIAFSRFLLKAYPNLKTVQRLIYEPDLIEISSRLVGLVELSSDGPILVSPLGFSAREVISLSLLAAYVGFRLGKLRRDALSSDELARITGKAKKTIMNELPRLVNAGYVERKPEGEYLITILGIRWTEEIIKDYRRRVKNPP